MCSVLKHSFPCSLLETVAGYNLETDLIKFINAVDIGNSVIGMDIRIDMIAWNSSADFFPLMATASVADVLNHRHRRSHFNTHLCSPYRFLKTKAVAHDVPVLELFRSAFSCTLGVHTGNDHTVCSLCCFYCSLNAGSPKLSGHDLVAQRIALVVVFDTDYGNTEVGRMELVFNRD